MATPKREVLDFIISKLKALQEASNQSGLDALSTTIAFAGREAELERARLDGAGPSVVVHLPRQNDPSSR